MAKVELPERKGTFSVEVSETHSSEVQVLELLKLSHELKGGPRWAHLNCKKERRQFLAD